MAEVPRDPRQLARDILAGKISIEELAREQARRTGGNLRVPPPPQQQPRVPDRIPLPRVPQAPRPVQRPVPPPRPVARQPVPKAPSRPVLTVPPPKPVRRVEPVIQRPVETAPEPVQRVLPPVAAPEATPKPASGAQLGIAKVMRNRVALRQCIVMAEVLGKPVALREEW